MISVVIPAFNAEQTIKKAVVSLLNQTFSDIEIIIIDDGSKDSTFAKCKELQKNDSRIKIIQSLNKGPSEARNLGIKAAQGEYIGFLDADDYIEPDMYEILYKVMLQSEVKVAFCNYKVEDICGKIQEHGGRMYESKIWSRKEIENDILLPMIGKRNESSKEKVVLGSVWRGLYSREICFKKNIWFDEGIDYGEDLLWLLKLLIQQDKIVTIEDRLYHYVIGKESLSNNIRQYNDKVWKKRKELILKIEKIVNGKICEEKIRTRINWRCRVGIMETISILGLSNNTNVNRKRSLKEILEDPLAKEAFSVLPEMKGFQAYLYRCIKRKAVNRIRILYYFHRMLKKE